jgi:hypothetical protein
MLFGLTFASLIAAGSALTLPNTYQKRAGAMSLTPHDQYSSSVGVLGCKINTNRVLYWPSSPSCDDICVELTANGRTAYALKIDQSGGAYDASYGLWNWLNTGEYATKKPTMGGGISVDYRFVDPKNCKHLIHPDPQTGERKLPIAAANGFAFANSCGKDTWVGRNLQLWNIADAVCNYGYDEKCSMPDLSVTNQPSCPHTLGAQPVMSESTCPVYNIQYGTGARVSAKTAA